MTVSIYDQDLRDQLRQYTADILDFVAKNYKINLEEFYQQWMDETGMIKTAKKKIIKLDTPQQTNNEVKELEYICLEKGEFLYDPNTFDVYSYPKKHKKPILLGKLEYKTGTIISL
jgi:hypothetical protein